MIGISSPSKSYNTPQYHHIKSHKMSTAELATSYAALILADDGVDITVRPAP